MGYDLNKFVDIQEIQSIPNHLKCLICSLVLEDPLQSKCEQPHYFCRQCIIMHLKSSNHCPHYDEDSVSVKSDKKKSPLRKMSFRKIIGKSPKDKFPILKLSDLRKLPDNVQLELKSLISKYNLDKPSEQNQPTTTTTTDNKPSIEENKNTTSSSSEVETQVVESIEEDMNPKQIKKQRKDSENKSVNGEMKPVSEEEVGSDDFVVIQNPENTSSTKSTESVQMNGSDPTIINSESKESVPDMNEDQTGVSKKKKKKKKKSATKQTDADTVSLPDATSLKDNESSSNSNNVSEVNSKESLVENEETKRALKDAEAKCENLRLINTQLLNQIKQLKEEKDEINKKLQTQLGTNGAEMGELRNRIDRLEKENKAQALQIKRSVNLNEKMNSYINTLKGERSQLKERYSSTLNDVQQIAKHMSTNTRRQAVN